MGLGPICSLKQETWLLPYPPSALDLLFPVLPQVGVSEAGLQHEILRRARNLLDSARVQQGADSGLFPGPRGPGYVSCGWQCRGSWLRAELWAQKGLCRGRVEEWGGSFGVFAFCHALDSCFLGT